MIWRGYPKEIKHFICRRSSVPISEITKKNYLKLVSITSFCTDEEAKAQKNEAFRTILVFKLLSSLYKLLLVNIAGHRLRGRGIQG